MFDAPAEPAKATYSRSWLIGLNVLSALVCGCHDLSFSIDDKAQNGLGGSSSRAGASGASAALGSDAGSRAGQAGARTSSEVAGAANNDGAHSGSADDKGTASTINTSVEETAVPICMMDPRGGSFPEANIGRVRGVGVSQAHHFGGFQMYAASAEHPVIGLKWQSGERTWTYWACFDVVTNPNRVAAANLPDGMPEIFVTTLQGRLLVRRQFPEGWSAWTDFTLPSPESHVSDVFTAPGLNNRNQLYVVDRGRVFRRFKTASAAYAPYSSWQDVGYVGGGVVTSGTLSDGRQQVFSIDANGNPITTVQQASELGTSFGAWADFGGDQVSQLIDIEAGQSVVDTLTVYAVDSAGKIWTRQQSNSNDWYPWAAWGGPSPPVKLVSLAMARRVLVALNPAILVGVGADGIVYEARREAVVWTDWQSLPSPP